MFLKSTLLFLALATIACAQQAGHPQLQYRLAQAQAAAAAAAQQHAQPTAQPQYAQPSAAQYAQPAPQPQQYAAVDARQLARLRAAQAAQSQGGEAPAPRGQYQPDPEDYDPNPQYQFSFDVKDDEFTNYQNRKEQREGGKISGSYSVVDADGFIRTVKYTADPLEGFKAEVTREPTNIVVKIPQPPAPQPQPQGLSATQRQLQTHQYLQGTIGVQPPQSQLYTSLGQLPKRLPHAGAQPAAPAPAPSPAPVRVQYAPAPSPAPVRYTAPQAQYSAAQAQQYSAAQAQQYSRSQPQQYSAPEPQQYTAQQYTLASAPAPASASEAAQRPIKAGAIGFATQEPGGGSVVYQAYQQ